MSQINKGILFGTFWSAIGHFGIMAISLITNIFLARILSYEFGQIGIIMFFITLFNVIVESGMGGALVRKENISKEDYSTVFVFNLLISILCFVLLIAFSGIIANFYNDESLQLLLVVSSIILLINAFHIIQNTQLMRDMKFKQYSKYRFTAVGIASITGIGLALIGAGVWSLVIMQLSIALLSTFILWYKQENNFSLKFNKNSFKELNGFGVNVSLASLLNSIFDNIYQLVLGKFFSLYETGLFYQAKRLQEVPVGVMRSTTLGVVFSSLSKIQTDYPTFKKTYNKLLLIFTVLLGMITSILFVYSETIIILLYGSEWIEAAIYVKLLSIAYFFYMQEMFNRVIFKVYNKTNKILRIEVVKKILQTFTVLLGIFALSIDILLYGLIVSNIFSYSLNLYYSNKVYKGVLKVEGKIVFKVIIVALFSAFFSVEILEMLIAEGGSGIFLLLSIPVFVTLYLAVTQLLGLLKIVDEITILIKTVKGYL